MQSQAVATGSLARDVVRGRRGAGSDVLFFPAAGCHGAVTAEAFAQRVRATAAALVREGVGAGDRVLLMSRTRLEWVIADYAIWSAGAVTVPVYETSSADQVRWIAQDSGAVAAIAETAQHRELLRDVPRFVWCLEEGALEGLPAPTEDEAAELEARIDAVDGEDTATVVYTSGTTGRPKGCVLTHANLAQNVDALYDALGELLQRPGARTLIFLPLAHVFARLGEVACVRHRIQVTLVPDPAQMPAVLAETHPTFFFAVPRVFEKLIAEVRRQAAAKGKLVARLFDAAEITAVASARAARDGRPLPRVVAVRHRVFDRLVYRQIRGALGGSVTHVVSSGGPLGERLGSFFSGAGIETYEAYGLSEALCATLNRPGAVRMGTVGKPVRGAEVRIDEGEVQLRGTNVFAGYLNRRDATADVTTDDGWFRTGDLGEIDRDGFLRITGRAKDLIITAAGKNVAPSGLEDRLREDPLISQAVVVGDGRPFVGCLLALDPDVAAAEPDVDARIQRAIAHANGSVSKAESIRRHALLPDLLTEEGGELTPTQKIKRNVVTERYAELIEGLYAGR